MINNWNPIRQNAEARRDLLTFANGSTSLNKLRRKWDGTPILSTIYRLERLGVDKARPRVRKALRNA